MKALSRLLPAPCDVRRHPRLYSLGRKVQSLIEAFKFAVYISQATTPTLPAPQQLSIALCASSAAIIATGTTTTTRTIIIAIIVVSSIINTTIMKSIIASIAQPLPAFIVADAPERPTDAKPWKK